MLTIIYYVLYQCFQLLLIYCVMYSHFRIVISVQWTTNASLKRNNHNNRTRHDPNLCPYAKQYYFVLDILYLTLDSHMYVPITKRTEGC